MISEYLNKNEVRILNRDYQQLLPLIKENDFLFVDPPYDSNNGNKINFLLRLKVYVYLSLFVLIYEI